MNMDELFAKCSPCSSFEFGQRQIGLGKPCFVIAEIGINHEGEASTCARLIEAAAASGADAVKLQTVDPNSNYAVGTPSHTLFAKSCLSYSDMDGLFRYARELNVEPFTTVGDLKTLRAIQGLEPAGYKVSSGLLTVGPLIRELVKTGGPVILSTGMATLSEVDDAVAQILNVGGSRFVVLQCTSLYPAPDDSLNLSVIRSFADRYRCPTGYSDHTKGETSAALAVAAGAKVIEKHFTLDATRPSYDHSISLEPKAFSRMVSSIRNVELMLGAPSKHPHPDERTKVPITRRYLAAGRDLYVGDILDETSVIFLRLHPGDVGLNPNEFDRVIGKKVARPMVFQQPFSESDFNE